MNAYSGAKNLEVMASAVNYNRFLTELVLRYARKGDRVLDFGAGIGTFAGRVKAAGYTVRCVEIDHDQAAHIAGSGISVVRALDEIESRSVDYIYTLNVLEHIEDDVGVLRELRQRLAPGGRMLVYVPAYQVLYSSMDRKVGHFRRYTLESLRQAIHAAGLTMEAGKYVDSLGFFASLAYRYFGNESGDLNEKALIAYDRVAFPLSRAADLACGRVFGKNVFLVAGVPASTAAPR
jgi:SAM-dependent methyltransferase